MEQLRSAVAAVASVAGGGRNKRFAAYKSLLMDRTDDNEDAEIVIDAHEQHRGDIQERVRCLASRLERSHANVNGSDAFLNWQRLARFVAERLRANLSAHFLIADRLDQAYCCMREIDTYRDSEEVASSLLPSFVKEGAEGVYLVDLLALLEMLCHGLAHQPEDTDVTLKHFLQCYGNECMHEHTVAAETAGLLPGNEKVSSHHCVVLVHQESAFYAYLQTIIPDGFLQEGEDVKDAHGLTNLRVVPLPCALAHVLTGKPASERVCHSTYDVVPLWPYFAWQHLTKGQ